MIQSVPIIRSLRQSIRYWPYEAVSWRQTIAQSGLPKNVQDLIVVVTRQSNLMRFEKIDVVHDLIAHFVDGLESGKNESQLIASFGDPKTTATMIHQAKKRNRPIMLKAAQLFGAICLMLISTYAVLWAYFNAGIPSPTTNFLPDFNQDVADVAETDKAWPIYRPVWTRYGFCEGGGFGKKIHDAIYVEDANGDLRYVRPGDETWPQTVETLAEWSDLLSCFREAATRPRLGLELQTDISNYSREDYQALFPDKNYPDNDNGSTLYSQNADGIDTFEDSIVMILLPHVQSFRSAARLLTIDNRIAIEQQDSERATQNMIAFYGLATHAADNNTLVGGLVGFAIARMGFDSLQQTLTEHPTFFDNSELARIQHVVEQLDVRSLIKLNGERAMVHDIIQRVYTDNGNGDGRITPKGLHAIRGILGSTRKSWSNQFPEFGRVANFAQDLVEPAVLFTSATRKQTTETYDAVMDLYESDLDQPFWKSDCISFDEFLDDNSIKHHVLNLLVPAIEQIGNQMHKLMGRQEAAIAAVASQRFFLVHRQWPDSIDKLSPDFVGELPVDVMTGDFIKMKIENGQMIFYSVGNDFLDDGAAPHTVCYSNREPELIDEQSLFLTKNDSDHASFNGDWILWPLNQQR